MHAKIIYSYKNDTSKAHENFSPEYTGALSGHFNKYAA